MTGSIPTPISRLLCSLLVPGPEGLLPPDQGHHGGQQRAQQRPAPHGRTARRRRCHHGRRLDERSSDAAAYPPPSGSTASPARSRHRRSLDSAVRCRRPVGRAGAACRSHGLVASMPASTWPATPRRCGCSARANSPQASLFGDGVHLLGVHWSFIVYPLALPATLASTANVLVVAQSIALGLAVSSHCGGWPVESPICVSAHRPHSSWPTRFYPAVHELALDDFHPEAFAVPGLIAWPTWDRSRTGSGIGPVWSFVLACRADLGSRDRTLGLRPAERRQTSSRDCGPSASEHRGRLASCSCCNRCCRARWCVKYGTYGDSLGEAIIQMVTNPLDLLGDLTSQSNVTILVGLLAPVDLPAIAVAAAPRSRAPARRALPRHRR